MNVTVTSPIETLYSGEARLVQLPGHDGLFEILDRHAPMLAMIKKGIIRIVDLQGKETNLDVERGILEVKNNKVSVLVL